MKNTFLLFAFGATSLIANSGTVAAQNMARVTATAPPTARPAAATAAAPVPTPPPAAAPTETAAVPTFVEQMPRFRGEGLDSLLLYLQQHLRYPDDAFIANASGRVYVSFVVNTQGKVEQVKLVKGVYASLDREALRVVNALPAWSAPGRQKGQVVSVAYTVPVAFQIEMAMLAMRGQSGQPGAAGRAATTSNSTATVGAGFPGGPDSLRAYTGRGARRADPAAQGQVFVEFDLDNDGRPRNVKALTPAKGQEQATPAAYAAATQLVEQSPAWNPGPANSRTRHQMLTLAFGKTSLAASVAYTNLQYPTFAGSQPTLDGLTGYIQRQAQYPQEAMDRREQGRVYVSFEVAESGEVEHVQIIGSVTTLLDAEVLRVIRSLPRATTPPVNSGQAVRASFTLPVAFVMR